MNPNTLNQIRNFLLQLVDMTDDQLNAWVKISKRSIYLKGEYYCTPDKPSTKLGYITKGLLRYYMLDQKGRERTFGFGGENVLVSSYGAVVCNQQHIKYIQAIEDTEVYTCERNDFINLWESSDTWKIFLQKATEMDNLVIRKRESDFLMYDAKTRYKIFLETYPQYRNRIKQEYVASYLGISPETLSRIKLDK